MGILICGFYRSGVQLVSNGIDAGNGTVDTMLIKSIYKEWNERMDFLGLNPKEKEKENFAKLWNNLESTEAIVPCFLHSKHWEEYIKKASSNSYVIIVYRPIEQVIDSMTREGIKQIYFHKKAFGRMRAIRKFNKILPQLQQNTKSAYIDYYQSAIQFYKEQKGKVHFLKSADFKNEFGKLIEKLNNENSVKITQDNKYFNADLFTQHKEIDTYRDKPLNEINAFFKAI